MNYEDFDILSIVQIVQELLKGAVYSLLMNCVGPRAKPCLASDLGLHCLTLLQDCNIDQDKGQVNTHGEFFKHFLIAFKRLIVLWG